MDALKRWGSNPQTLGISAGGMKALPGMLGAKAHTVDRIMLRSLLLLDQESQVKFGKSFHHYELTHNGVNAFFADGTCEEGTLLVGADGVASLVGI
jgi:2-polyprenyl-6-methoxyphenol hydroxylase-like FAD-dependent oxidoreductase